MSKNKKVHIIGSAGNTKSLSRALAKTACRAVPLEEEANDAEVERIIFCGVGAFGSAMLSLSCRSLSDRLNELVISREVSFLGICVGMQILFEASEESQLAGLSWLKGSVKKNRIARDCYHSVHTGWSSIYSLRNRDRGRSSHHKLYFLHQYHCVPNDQSIVEYYVEYGDSEFVSAIAAKNINGVQFHPEKSGSSGLRFLRKFVQDGTISGAL